LGTELTGSSQFSRLDESRLFAVRKVSDALRFLVVLCISFRTKSNEQSRLEQCEGETTCGIRWTALPAEDGTLLITTHVSRSVSDEIPLEEVYENYRATLSYPFLLVPPDGAVESQ
jgi:hypothetical protein